jgi:PTH1 family peptidyl-tRNA hydrolase
MKLLVGLGNPGFEYSKTRHNIGFMVTNKIIQETKVNKKFNCIVGNIGNLVIAMAQTYMNRSGEAIGQVMRFYKINIDNLIVVHDDIDLELGKIKIKRGGGNGGHNGLKSIDQNVGNNYLRIRLGVGRPSHGNVSNYVLEKFTIEELPRVEKMIKFTIENLDKLTIDNLSQNDIGKLLNDYK